MMWSVIPSNPQSSILVLPMIRIKIAFKRVVFFYVKLTVIFENRFYFDKIETLYALEVQDFEAF